jgi:monoamine oxidase
MKRRKFVRNSTLFSMGGLLIPGVFMSSCKEDTLFMSVDFQGKVLIIGAGVAGLYAGYLLKENGINFQILEASSNHGGRVGKLSTFADFPIDLGAQWLHGNNNILGDLIKKSKTKTSLDDSALQYWFNGELVPKLPQDINIFEGDDLPDVSFQDYATQKGFTEEYKYVVETIAGDQGASASRLSVLNNNLEEENWSSGEEDYKFEETFFDLIDREIASKVKDEMLLDTVVDKIDYSQSVIVVTDKKGNRYEVDKVIITVPITILKDGDISFVPVLPRNKINAFSKIGMDAGMKVFLKFHSKFYDQNISGGRVSAAYADDSVGKLGADHVLLAFVMGDQAEVLTGLGNDEAITNALLEELDTMYEGQATATFVSSHVENWTTNPFVRGAYSYSLVGIGDARKVAAESIDDKIYFAGEAMNVNGHHQTVHGAVETGYREVINILNSVKK